MQIERYTADRDALLELFALADDSPAHIASYVALGDILVARDGPDIVGHAQVINSGEVGVLELKSLAVIEAHRGEGIGSELVEAASAFCRERDGHRLIVSTAAAATGTLRFYQRRGFRMFRVVQDAFGPAEGYAEGLLIDGIPLRDQVFLELDVEG